MSRIDSIEMGCVGTTKKPLKRLRRGRCHATGLKAGVRKKRGKLLDGSLGHRESLHTGRRRAVIRRKAARNLPPKYIWPRNLRRFVLKEQLNYEKTIIVTPLALAAALLTSCTTVWKNLLRHHHDYHTFRIG